MKSKAVLFGDIEFLNLGDVIQLLGSNDSTGVLRLISRYASEPASVYFYRGNPIDAQIGNKRGLDAMYSLFGWTVGEFEFISKPVPLEQKTIKKSRMSIVLDGMKLFDDGKIEILGPGTAGRKKSEFKSSKGVIPIVKGPLVDYTYVVDEEDFFDGESIVEQGKHGNWIWIILEGVVEVRKETPKGSVPLIRLSDGSFIGGLGTFLVEGNIRTATALSLGNVQLGVLDTQRLAQEYAKLSTEFKAFLFSLDNRLNRTSQFAMEFYTQLADPDRYVSEKQPVMDEKEPSEQLYLIEQGTIVVVRNTSMGIVPVAHLKKGDFFGHIPFLEIGHEPYSASILASNDLKAITIDSSLFQAEFETLSATFKNLVSNMANCISATSDIVCGYRAAVGASKRMYKS